MWWKNSEFTQSCGLTGTERPGYLGDSVRGCLFTVVKLQEEWLVMQVEGIPHWITAISTFGVFFKWYISSVGSYLVLIHSKEAPWKV